MNGGGAKEAHRESDGVHQKNYRGYFDMVRCYMKRLFPLPPCVRIAHCPLDLPHCPLEVDELVHQQEGAGQVRDAGL